MMKGSSTGYGDSPDDIVSSILPQVTRCMLHAGMDTPTSSLNRGQLSRKEIIACSIRRLSITAVAFISLLELRVISFSA